MRKQLAFANKETFHWEHTEVWIAMLHLLLELLAKEGNDLCITAINHMVDYARQADADRDRSDAFKALKRVLKNDLGAVEGIKDLIKDMQVDHAAAAAKRVKNDAKRKRDVQDEQQRRSRYRSAQRQMQQAPQQVVQQQPTQYGAATQQLLQQSAADARPRCNHCNLPGHDEARCYRLHPELDHRLKAS